jgi:hypothetical protein
MGALMNLTMSASSALMIVFFAGEPGHIATLAMVALALFLAAGVGICALRSRRATAPTGLTSTSRSSCSSASGCGRQ